METLEVLQRDIYNSHWNTDIYFAIDSLEQYDVPNVHALLNSFVEKHRYHSIGSAWREVDASGARAIVLRILHTDLVYKQEMMPLNKAETLADQVMDYFDPNAKYYTNGDYDQETKKQSVGWTPISDSSFDTGVVFVDGDQIGMVWVEDED